MSQASNGPDELPSSPARNGRSWSPVTVVLLAGVLALVVWLLINRSGSNIPRPLSAVDLVEEIRQTLPPDQQAAFADDFIDEDEIQEAVDRFEACAAANQIVAWVESYDSNGVELRFAEPTEPNAVGECLHQHFEATYSVWREQEHDH